MSSSGVARLRTLAATGVLLVILGVLAYFVAGRVSRREALTPSAPPAPHAGHAIESVAPIEQRASALSAESKAPRPQAVVETPSPAPAELTAEEIRTLREKHPPGEVVVLVLRGRAPIEGASVDLRAASLGVFPEDDPSIPEGAQRILTDATGRAKFHAVSPGEYRIAARAEPKLVAQVVEVLDAAAAETETIVLSFGTSGIRGHVYRADGSPWPGAIVYVTYAAHPLRDMFVTDLSGAEGAYELAGLASGSVWLVQLREPEAAEENRVGLVNLAPNEWKVSDFGSPLGTCTFEGVVRLAQGEPIPEGGQLELEHATTRIRHRIVFAAGGAFSTTLDRGTYELAIWGFSGRVALGEVALDRERVTYDPVVPGMHLGGRVRYTGSWHDPTQPQHTAQVWLRDGSGKQELASQRQESAYAFLALEPGRYTLTTYPQQIVGAPSGGVVVELSAAEPSVTIDLEITDP